MNTLSSILNWIGSVIGANPNTLTTSNKTIVGAINEVDADMNNTVHITESGTSGVWTYRKWSDGVSECWCQSEAKTLTPDDWVAWNQVFEARIADQPINYPTGLFVSAPQLTLLAMPTTGYTIMSAEISVANNTDVSIQTPMVYGIRANKPQGNVTAVVNFHAVGRWR